MLTRLLRDRFNTKKVRLKLKPVFDGLKSHLGFNTKKVRLKHNAGTGGGQQAITGFNTKKVRLKLP